MHFDGWTFALQAVNFAVLVWLLNRFLYKPVRRLLIARREELERQSEACAVLKKQLEQQLTAAAADRSQVAAEREGLLKQAAAEAEQLLAQRRERAEHDAKILVEQARLALEAERANALIQARRVALDLACEMAGRLLRETPLELDSEGCLQRIERYLTGLPAPERERLALSIRSDGAIPESRTLRVTTATLLQPKTMEAWSERLQRALGRRVDIEFQTDPALLAGAEVGFPLAALHLSWRAMLASMRSEIESLNPEHDALAHQ